MYDLSTDNNWRVGVRESVGLARRSVDAGMHAARSAFSQSHDDRAARSCGGQGSGHGADGRALMAGHRRLRTREILSDRYELTDALDRRVTAAGADR
jgi:hypothetical protein